MLITPHFDIDEFRCHDTAGTRYPWQQIDSEPPHMLGDDAATVLTVFAKDTWGYNRLVPLCLTLETIREASGAAITVDSGYRTLEYDEKLYEASAKDGSVAPASRSQHPKGRAADIVSAVHPPAILHALILRLFEEGRLPYLGGLGIYSTFCHVDVRFKFPADHLAQWNGARSSNSI